MITRGHDSLDRALRRCAVRTGPTRPWRSLVRMRLLNAPPPRIGRYELRGRIGSGGMGDVMRAYDHLLRREVALKLVQDSGSGRLREEARALASISHDNVVRVLDAGSSGASPYIAMELLEGENLRDWLTLPRTRAEILAVLADAARGLQAIHARDLVHGDIKPDNIVVTEDGRARLVDLGLARRARIGPSTVSTHAASTSEDAEDTSPRVVFGTPAYMAPELALGGEPDPATDVYALGITAIEALTGMRPGQGALPVVPRSLTRELRRMLVATVARDPRRRPIATAEIVRAFEPTRPVRRHGFMLAVFVFLSALGLVSSQPLRASGPPACRELAGELGLVWSEQTRATLAARVESGAEAAFAELAGATDDFVRAWTEAREAACPDEAPTPRREATLQCLARQRERIAAVIDELRDQPAIGPAVAGLAPSSRVPATCAEPRDDEGYVAPEDPIVERRLRPLRRAYERLYARHQLRGPLGLAEQAKRLLVATEAAGHPGLTARVRLLYADSLRMGQDAEAALSELGLAYEEAVTADDRATAFWAAAVAAQVSGTLLEDPSGASDWLRSAEAQLHRAGDSAVLAINLDQIRGVLAAHAGHVDAARAAFSHALALAHRSGRLAPRDLAALQLNVATHAMRADDLQEALELTTRAERTIAQNLPPDHYLAPIPISQRAIIHLQAERFDEARRALDESVRWTRTYATASPSLLSLMAKLRGTLAMQLGDYESCVAAFGEPWPGSSGAHAVWSMQMQARCLAAQGRTVEARERLAALAGAEHATADPLTLVDTWRAEIEVLVAEGLVEDALALARRSIDHRLAHGLADGSFASDLVLAAQLAFLRGQLGAAAEWLQAADVQLRGRPGRAPTRAEVVLWRAVVGEDVDARDLAGAREALLPLARHRHESWSALHSLQHARFG